jgi:hypothetical protein
MAVRHASDAVAKVLELLNGSDLLCNWLEGDHELIGATPAGCIFPGAVDRAYVGMPRRTEAVIQVFVMLYHGSNVPRGTNQSDALALENAVVDLLEKDANLGDDLVINTFVTKVEHGEVVRTRSKYYATRISLAVTTRFNIGLDYD